MMSRASSTWSLGVVSSCSKRTALARVPQGRMIRPRASASATMAGQRRVRVVGDPVGDQLEGHHGAQAAHVADGFHALAISQRIQARLDYLANLGRAGTEAPLPRSRPARHWPQPRPAVAGIGAADAANGGGIDDLGPAGHG